MKWGIRNILIVLLAVLVFVANANAALVDNGNGTISDTITNLMWLQDANYAQTSGYDSDGKMTWANAMDWASNLVYAGYDNWRLPTTLVPDNSCGYGDPSESTGYCSGSELGNLYFNENITPWEQTPFYNVKDGTYWSSTDYPSVPSAAYHLSFGLGGSVWGGGWQDSKAKVNSTYAWAVRDITVVPEPISSLLFVTGGILLAGRRYLRRKK